MPGAPSLLACGTDAIQLGWIPLDGVEFKLLVSSRGRDFEPVQYVTTDAGHIVQEIGGQLIAPSTRYSFVLVCENDFGQSGLSEELYVETPEGVLEQQEVVEGGEGGDGVDELEDQIVIGDELDMSLDAGDAAAQSGQAAVVEGLEEEREDGEAEESTGYSTALVLDETETDFVDLPANWRECESGTTRERQHHRKTKRD